MKTTTNEPKMVRCMKCDGAGTIDHLRHVDDGACFACDGTGVVESRPIKLRPVTHDVVQNMRNRYRNARLPESNPCHCSYEEMVDPNGNGWTHEGLVAVMDQIPGCREAFRSLGWPV
jgi:RecJ-like exonuclease